MSDDFPVAYGQVGFFEQAFVFQEEVEFAKVIAGDAREDVVLDVKVDLIWRDGEAFPPACVGCAGVQAGIGIVEVGHGGMLGGVTQAHVEHVAGQPCGGPQQVEPAVAGGIEHGPQGGVRRETGKHRF